MIEPMTVHADTDHAGGPADHSGNGELYELADPPPELAAPSTSVRPAVKLDRERLCPGCGYDMRGTQSNVCPECGERYRESLERTQRAQIDWSDLWTLRWMLYGCLPTLVWIPFAFALEFALGTLGAMLLLPTGALVAMGGALWAGKEAMEEVDVIAGLGMVLMIAFCSGMLNLMFVGLAVSWIT